VSASEIPAEEVERLREIFSRVPFARLLGLEFVGAERGSAVFVLDAREDLMRMGDILHGGAVFSLLDTAAACAVHTILEPGDRTVTVDLTVHFLRPFGSGRLYARARILRAGRRIAFLSVEATDPAGVLISTATTTYAIQRAADAPARP
jgi:uncharacterized protein (TIGR00369 family)